MRLPSPVASAAAALSLPHLLAVVSSAFSLGVADPRPGSGGRRAFLSPSYVLRGGSSSSPTASGAGVSALQMSTTAASGGVVSAENLALLSDRGRAAVEALMSTEGQAHVTGGWPEPGTEDDGKRTLAEQLADLDGSYPGGLSAYLSKARRLLAEAASGDSPFEDYIASVPSGEVLSYEDDGAASADGALLSFGEAEAAGLGGIGEVAFVLVAGGLGERLGFSGIKLGLSTNVLTDRCYLEVYCNYIKAMQRRSAVATGRDDAATIPLVIMTSGDTDARTKELLADNGNFGMGDGQIRIVCQDKVPALGDASAGLSMASKWEVETKPHGHGDVHHLLCREGIVDEWERQGIKHVVFLQDTNALVINGVLPTLGVSILRGFHMNSICIPRLAGEAAGAIARLEHKTDPEKSLVINVEYNQLGPLLSSQGDRKGDVADPSTGYSPYPGNANNIVFEISSYAKTLRGEDAGVVDEFVNPKYKDDTRTAFKKPTRLECMMQDFPKLLQKEMGSSAKVGFTTLDRWLTFSPAKNSLESGVEAVAAGSAAPGTMSSAESDKYVSNACKLAAVGMVVPDAAEGDTDNSISIRGIPVTEGPRIVLCPAFAITRGEIRAKFMGGSVTKRSTLVLDGDGLTVKNLKLDGALVVRTAPGCEVEVDGLEVTNGGWTFEEVPEGQAGDVPETVAIRGYTVNRKETKEIIITEPGKYFVGKDGEVKKLG